MRTRVPCLVLVTAAIALGISGVASAATTIGSTTQPAGSSSGGCGPGAVVAQIGTDPSYTYVVPPSGGGITRWSTNTAGATVGTPITLVVLRPAVSSYTVVGVDARTLPNPLPVSNIATFNLSTPIVVKGGDIIGLYSPATSGYTCYWQGGALTSGDIVAELTDGTAPATGQALPIKLNSPSTLLNVAATIAPSAGITSVSPATGSISGGTSVVISGHDFTGASAVSFGGTAASHFTVNSDGQITATSPARSTPGTVDIRVTNPAGQTAIGASDHFTYTACVVPKLKQKTLKQAKKALKHAGCTLGKVKPKHHKKSSKVKSQKPKSGTVLPPGSKVNIKL